MSCCAFDFDSEDTISISTFCDADHPAEPFSSEIYHCWVIVAFGWVVYGSGQVTGYAKRKIPPNINAFRLGIQ